MSCAWPRVWESPGGDRRCAARRWSFRGPGVIDSAERSSTTRPGYVIRVEGHLTAAWADWFGGLTLRCHPDGTTTLSGPIKDQAALHGVLLKVRDLGLALVSVNPIDSRPGEHRLTEDPVRDGKELEEEGGIAC